MQPLPSYGAEGNMAKTNTAKAKKRNINRIAYLFVLPFVIVFLVFSVYPVLRTLYLSFTNYKGFGDATWTGLDNYKRVITDKFFWRDLGNTIKIWGVNIVLQLGLAFLLTVIFSDIKYKIRGLAVFRAVYYLPNQNVIGLEIRKLQSNPDDIRHYA